MYAPQSSIICVTVAGQQLEQALGHVPSALLDQLVVVRLCLVALRVVVAEEVADDRNEVRHDSSYTSNAQVMPPVYGLGRRIQKRYD